MLLLVIQLISFFLFFFHLVKEQTCATWRPPSIESCTKVPSRRFLSILHLWYQSIIFLWDALWVNKHFRRCNSFQSFRWLCLSSQLTWPTFCCCLLFVVTAAWNRPKCLMSGLVSRSQPRFCCGAENNSLCTDLAQSANRFTSRVPAFYRLFQCAFHLLSYLCEHVTAHSTEPWTAGFWGWEVTPARCQSFIAPDDWGEWKENSKCDF